MQKIVFRIISSLSGTLLVMESSGWVYSVNFGGEHDNILYAYVTPFFSLCPVDTLFSPALILLSICYNGGEMFGSPDTISCEFVLWHSPRTIVIDSGVNYRCRPNSFSKSQIPNYY